MGIFYLKLTKLGNDKLDKTPSGPYDKVREGVVIERDEQMARQMMADIKYDNEGFLWLDPDLSTCEELNPDDDPMIVCLDILEG